MNSVFSVRLPTSVVDVLTEHASAIGVDRTTVIRSALVDYMLKHQLEIADFDEAAQLLEEAS